MKGKTTKECKLCRNNTKKIDHPTIAYRSCPNCEFVFKEDKYLVSKDEELEIYNTHNNSIEDPRCLEFFYKFLNAAVFPYASAGKEGLDFGSGSSPVLAEILETNHNYKMHIYDLFYFPEKSYKGKKYDLITSTEVVEHLKNPMEYFKLFTTLLKPQGILAVMTLFHQNDQEHFQDWFYIRDPSHISFFTRNTMEYIAKEVGLKIIYCDNSRYTTFALD